MTDESTLLDSAVSEYNCIVTILSHQAGGQIDTDNLLQKFSLNHDWTEHGARAIITLANDYGAFMLRNALALAIALNKEDGDLGF